jgi:hypothetical protein
MIYPNLDFWFEKDILSGNPAPISTRTNIAFSGGRIAALESVLEMMRSK